MRNPILKRYTVEGYSDFPLNMLRVDQCWPAGRGDAERIRESLAATGTVPAPQRITFETAAKYAPDRRRWLSLGWPVVD